MYSKAVRNLDLTNKNFYTIINYYHKEWAVCTINITVHTWNQTKTDKTAAAERLYLARSLDAITITTQFVMYQYLL